MSEKISGRQNSDNVIVSTGPDVCLTPVGSALVPVAYTSVAFMGESERISPTVLDNEDPDFQLNSRTVTSTGHEAGVGAGVVVPGYKGEAFIQEASPTVFSEGYATTRHRDPAFINRPDAGAAEPRMPLTLYHQRVTERVEAREIREYLDSVEEEAPPVALGQRRMTWADMFGAETEAEIQRYLAQPDPIPSAGETPVTPVTPVYPDGGGEVPPVALGQRRMTWSDIFGEDTEAEIQRYLAEREADELEADMETRELEPGTNESVETANGGAQLVTGATAPPEKDYRRRPGESERDYFARLREDGLSRASRRAKDPQQEMRDLRAMWDNGLSVDPNRNAWEQRIPADAYHNPMSVDGATVIYEPPTGGRFEMTPEAKIESAMAMTEPPPFAWGGADGRGYQTDGPTWDAMREEAAAVSTDYITTRDALSQLLYKLQQVHGPPIDHAGEYKRPKAPKKPLPQRQRGLTVRQTGRAIQMIRRR